MRLTIRNKDHLEGACCNSEIDGNHTEGFNTLVGLQDDVGNGKNERSFI